MIPITLYLLHGEDEHDLVILIIIAAAEIPAALVCYLLVDRKEFGRKNLMAMGYGFVILILCIGVAAL